MHNYFCLFSRVLYSSKAVTALRQYLYSYNLKTFRQNDDIDSEIYDNMHIHTLKSSLLYVKYFMNKTDLFNDIILSCLNQCYTIRYAL